jgi:hypothetical protein
MDNHHDTDPRRLEELRRRALERQAWSSGRRSDGAATGQARTAPLTPAERKAVRESVAKGLSPTQRAVLILAHLEGMSFAEMAATLDMPASRVERMYRSIVRRVRLMIEQAVGGRADVRTNGPMGVCAAGVRLRRESGRATGEDQDAEGASGNERRHQGPSGRAQARAMHAPQGRRHRR